LALCRDVNHAVSFWGVAKQVALPVGVLCWHDLKSDFTHFFSQSLSKQGLQQSNEPYSPSDPSIDMMVVVISQISHFAVPISTHTRRA
jgi:hypothetical protein